MMATRLQGGLAAGLLAVSLGACGSSGSSNSGPTGAPPGGTPAAGGGPTLQGCPVFPADNPWNRDVSGDAVDPRSDAYVASMKGGSRFLHADFGSDPTYGIPWTTVPGSQPRVPMSFDYADESDPGPYPFPPDAPVEAGGDRHVLVMDRDACRLYETYDSHYQGSAWHCGSGAIFDLRSNGLRPDGWTSADAAGPAFYRRPHAAGVRPPRHPLRERRRQPQPAAHGPKSAAQGLL